MKNYIQNLRSKLGSDKFIHPGARIIIENKNQEVLIVERKDNGKIGLPAGALEENETIEDCIRREVKEETGLELIDLEIIGLSSNPALETVIYPNGDTIQYFTVEFYSNSWQGTIQIKDNVEIKTAKFIRLEQIKDLPKNELSTFDSLKYYKQHKSILLK